MGCGGRLEPEGAEPWEPRGTRRSARAVAIAVALGLVLGSTVTAVVVISGRDEEALAPPPDGGGCGDVQERPDHGAPHLGPDEDYVPPERPAASGVHDANPLPPEPRVYREPVPEARAVHNLEHAYVLIYYRALSADVVTALEELAESEEKVIVAPYPELPEGSALAFVAWRRVQHCSAGVSVGEATDAARAFIAEFRGGGVAPEPGAA